MAKPVYDLSEKPFFLKLGFFSKKAYVIYLSYYLFLDYIFVLIFGENKLQVIQFGIPYSLTILVFFHIIFFGGLYIFSKIESLFGIDFIADQKEKDLPAPLISTLFTEEGFQDFQKFASIRLNKKWITIVAGFLTALVTLFGLWGPFIFFQADEWIENFPELAENGLYYFYLIFRIGPYSLIAIWFLFSVLSLLFLIIELMVIFNALGSFSGLSLSKISEYFDSSLVNEKSNVFSNNAEVVQFSLKRFRRKCKVIPAMFLKINLGISLVTFFLGILFSIYTSYFFSRNSVFNLYFLHFARKSKNFCLFFLFSLYSRNYVV